MVDTEKKIFLGVIVLKTSFIIDSNIIALYSFLIIVDLSRFNKYEYMGSGRLLKDIYP